MSLVENLARRQHSPVELMREIGALRARGYTDDEIARKTGVSATWAGMIAGLLEKGEERLVAAVETGMLPIGVATEIARTGDAEIQALLEQAYAEGKIGGRKLVALRRLLDQRARRGAHLRLNEFGQRRGSGKTKPTSTEGLVRVYQQEADRQRLLVKKAEIAQSRLLFVVEGFRTLRRDAEFVDLLESEGLATMPRYLDEQLAAAGRS